MLMHCLLQTWRSGLAGFGGSPTKSFTSCINFEPSGRCQTVGKWIRNYMLRSVVINSPGNPWSQFGGRIGRLRWEGWFGSTIPGGPRLRGTATPIPNPTRSSAIAERPRDAPCQLNRAKCRTNVRRIAFDKSCNRRTTFKVTGDGSNQ